MTSVDIEDPYLWLEQEMDGPRVREWLAARNAETVQALEDARFEADRKAALDLLNADDRIPFIGRRGPHVYNFWQDAAHPKGLWRRTTLADYRVAQRSGGEVLHRRRCARRGTRSEDWVWRGLHHAAAGLCAAAWCSCRAAAPTRR